VRYWGMLLLFTMAIAAMSQADTITALLKAQNWKLAEKELASYIAQNPNKVWAYTSRVWALENLQRYEEAISVARAAVGQWPDDAKVKSALARVLIKKAGTMRAREAHTLFVEAFANDPREFTEFSVARSYRDLGELDKAIAQMQEGRRKYPTSPLFAEGLPYTRYLYFKTLRTLSDRSRMREQIEIAAGELRLGSYDQFYYKQVLRLGLRDLADRAFFQSTYDSLFKVHPQSAQLHDDYGFQLYANYRMHGKADDALRQEAISWRRKAFDLYWKGREVPAPIVNLSFPLKGFNTVWSEFGGTAMTHNGLSKFCYDFAAVDKSKNIKKPGTSGKVNADYYMFGSPVFAVADGIVSGIIDGFPDNKPGGYAGDANTITLKHAGFLSFYAHMKANGVLVREGQRVKRGALIGYAGNSGMSSESHLHFCISSPEAGEVTIPFQFAPAVVEPVNGVKKKTNAFYREGDVVFFP
jgi:murein DD-endopeptidase MepM/ murein hydrolase activator NlpD